MSVMDRAEEHRAYWERVFNRPPPVQRDHSEADHIVAASQMSATRERQFKKTGVIHCVQCRRPFGPNDIFKVGRVYLCAEDWEWMASEYQAAYPDWRGTAAAWAREGRAEARW